ncbi:protein of unknown function [Geodermatophilus amargosae]|uniref:Uncharacterized protein n=1 Tax=Geodermatophilus amargosae TaxID=1296565 RepID=A0A1I6XCC2_9ACTN|nr:nitroreductase/quinone reductase family protein [Geodermatophilus amargosae]SFT35888.1 protein of unknown function [Geodermatophilus amargosae]
MTAALSRADRAATVLFRRVAALHTALLRRTGGRVGNRFRGGDVVLVTCRGWRSGQPRTTPLLHVRDGADLVVAASDGGIDADRPRLWAALMARCDAYDGYRARVSRRIAVVRLSPAQATATG